MAEDAAEKQEETLSTQESSLLEKLAPDILLFAKVREMVAVLSKTKDWIVDNNLKIVCACLLVITVIAACANPLHQATTADDSQTLKVLKQTARLLAKQQAVMAVGSQEAPVANFNFDDKVPVDQQEQIRDGTNKAVELIGSTTGVKVKNLSVYAYGDSDKLIDEYLKNTLVVQDRDQTLKRLSRATAFIGEKDDIYINCASDGWLVNSPIIGSGVVEGRYNTIFHEYFHLVQKDLGFFRTEFPMWLNEGSCQYVAAKGLADSGLYDFAKIRSGNVSGAKSVKEQLHTMETVGGFAGAGEEHADEYPLGFLAVEYLMVGKPNGGIGDLTEFCQQVGRGTPWQEAFESSFGKSPEQFYSEFEAYRARGFT